MKPCPACDRTDAEVVQTMEIGDYAEEVFMVVCQCGNSTDYFYSPEKATAAWDAQPETCEVRAIEEFDMTGNVLNDLPPMESMLVDLAKIPEVANCLGLLFACIDKTEKAYEDQGPVDVATAKSNYCTPHNRPA